MKSEEDIGIKMMIGSVSYVGMNVRVQYVHVLWEFPAYDTIRNISWKT